MAQVLRYKGALIHLFTDQIKCCVVAQRFTENARFAALGSGVALIYSAPAVRLYEARGATELTADHGELMSVVSRTEPFDFSLPDLSELANW